jgi:hypothetical protein
MIFETNRVYEFDLGDMSDSVLTHDEMIKHYEENSSPLSFITEKYLSKWFDNLESFKKYNGTTVKNILCSNGENKIKIVPDLIDTITNVICDQKAFSAKGGSCRRSNEKGVGREKNQHLWESWLSAQTMIWTDFCKLPKMKVIGLTGDECLRRFPTGNISFKDRESLFTSR